MATLNVRTLVSQILQAARAGANGLPQHAGHALMLLAAAGSLSTLAGSQARAADAPAAAGDLDEIVVTGIRHGIESAIEVKRDSGSIVEAISAEDIGKLPDTSIAESLSRLPGLTSQRAEGRASAISLRGTDPGFTTALLNGREQVSTGDNRSIEFDQYPSELLSGVVVYKTPDAQLIGQGLAGTIDMRTVRPLSYGKRVFVFNVRGERNSHSDLGADSTDQGYRASFSYIDQFADNTLGLTVGLARLQSPLATEGFGTYEPWSSGSPSTTGGMKVRTDMGKNTRDGALATLEWKPNDSITSVLDLYYTKSKETDNARSIEVNLGGYPAPCCDGQFAPGTVFGTTNPVIRNNTVTGGTLNNVLPLVRNFQFITDDKIFATGWNTKWTSGAWSAAGDVSYSKATRDQFQPETNAEYAPDTLPSCTTVAVSPTCHTVVPVTQSDGSIKLVDTPRNAYDTGQYQLSSDHMPAVTFQKDYTDPSQVQIGPTIYGTGYVKNPHIKDELKSARIDVARELTGWFSKLAVGVNYADRSKNKQSPETSLSTLNGGFTPIASQYLLTPTNLGYAGAPSVLAWDVPSVLNAYYKPIVYGTPETLSYLVGKWWTVTEKITTSFIKADLNHDLGEGVTLKGNLGLQILNTNQSSDAFFNNTATGKVTPFSDGKKYTDVLPAINLIFGFVDQQSLRVGLAKEEARPRMDQLKASKEGGAAIVVDQNGNAVRQPSASTGNPRLDPWRADAFDLSYEKYFDNKAYVSSAVFYKKLKSYIYNTTEQNVDFTSFVSTLPPNYACTPSSCPPTVNTGPLTGPQNGSGGTLKGFELSASLPGELFSDSLRGFGTILSISQTESNITVKDGGGNNVLSGNNLGVIPLPGLSKTVWSTTFYYENAGFSARIATRARSKYIGEVTNFANDRAFKYVKGDQITDFQTGYEFSGRLQGLSVLFQVNNLTDSPYVAYQRNESQLIDYQTYGRQYLLGVNLKL